MEPYNIERCTLWSRAGQYCYIYRASGDREVYIRAAYNRGEHRGVEQSTISSSILQSKVIAVRTLWRIIVSSNRKRYIL